MNNFNVKKKSATTPNDILFSTANYFAVSIVVDAAVGTNVNGVKIAKAGTPLAGSLEERTTPFVKATGADAVGVLLHDVDVSNGNNNATLLVTGEVNLERLDTNVASLITQEIKTALNKIVFAK